MYVSAVISDRCCEKPTAARDRMYRRPILRAAVNQLQFFACISHMRGFELARARRRASLPTRMSEALA